MIYVNFILLAAIFISGAAATPVAKRSTGPAAQVSYLLPEYINPVQAAPSPTYWLWPANNTDFEVESVEDFGMMEDPENPLTIYRDGGGSCNLANRTIWFFCDTLGYDNNTFTAMTDNSLSVAQTFDDPSLLADATSNSLYSYGWQPAIPYTVDEYPVRNSPSQRFTLWTYTNCIEISDTQAAHFFLLTKSNSIYSSTSWGNTMAILDLDTSTNMLTVTRNQQVMFPNTTYSYGSFASLVIDGVAFLYALDYTYSGNQDVHVARVATWEMTDITKYQYYDASTKTWNYTQPQPTARRQSAAVISNWIPYSTGSMFYSEYHNAYLLIYFNGWADSTFRVSYAPSPVGPWTTNDQTLYTLPDGQRGYDYGGGAHVEYYQDDGPSGKSILLHYSYQDTSYTYPRAAKLTFV
ncbi:hypothetical protein V1525DRAFT_410158 [Lipomyces kononenkoae]|uniref:Uncharacterized protein n=1 Tax=Lipomyces kononenkoae TaxID=34357 RepID=A0ACC3SVS5_LIPKO